MENKTFDRSNCDPLFVEVAHYVVERQAVSASAISDKFCIGFNRAERIIKQLEQAYIIGEKWSSLHPRKIYYCCARKLDKKLADLATIARLQPLEQSVQQMRQKNAKRRARITISNWQITFRLPRSYASKRRLVSALRR